MAESHNNMMEKRKYTSQAAANRQQVEPKSLRVWKERDAAGGVGVQTDRDKAHVFGGNDKVQRKTRFDVLFTKKGAHGSYLTVSPFDTHVCAPTDLTPTGLKLTASM